MAENDDLDFFPTPWGLVYAALRDYHAEVYRPKAILDAGAGDGRWGKVARELWPNTRIDAIDIVRHPGFDPSPYDNVYTADFLTWEPQSEYGEMIGNPPYNKWEAFLECGLALPGVKDVYMLLRLGVLAGINRVQKFYPRPHHVPMTVAVISPRPVFVGKTSDPRTDYGMFRWSTSLNEKQWIGSFLTWNRRPEDGGK